MSGRKQNETNRYSVSEINPGSDYTDDELEFLSAMERYKRERHRRFPTFTEVLAVAVSLGYRKTRRADDAPPIDPRYMAE